jgi:hypothetical protein
MRNHDARNAEQAQKAEVSPQMPHAATRSVAHFWLG